MRGKARACREQLSYGADPRHNSCCPDGNWCHPQLGFWTRPYSYRETARWWWQVHPFTGLVPWTKFKVLYIFYPRFLNTPFPEKNLKSLKMAAILYWTMLSSYLQFLLTFCFSPRFPKLCSFWCLLICCPDSSSARFPAWPHTGIRSMHRGEHRLCTGEPHWQSG